MSRNRASLSADLLGEEVHRVLRDRRALRRRQVRPIEAGLAVNVGGHERIADQRSVGPGCDRNLVASDEVEDADRVRGRLLERLVARDRGDAEQLELRGGDREQQRDRVVVAGITVEQDRRRH